MSRYDKDIFMKEYKIEHTGFGYKVIWEDDMSTTEKFATIDNKEYRLDIMTVCGDDSLRLSYRQADYWGHVCWIATDAYKWDTEVFKFYAKHGEYLLNNKNTKKKKAIEERIAKARKNLEDSQRELQQAQRELKNL